MMARTALGMGGPARSATDWTEAVHDRNVVFHCFVVGISVVDSDDDGVTAATGG